MYGTVWVRVPRTSTYLILDFTNAVVVLPTVLWLVWGGPSSTVMLFVVSSFVLSVSFPQVLRKSNAGVAYRRLTLFTPIQSEILLRAGAPAILEDERGQQTAMFQRADGRVVGVPIPWFEPMRGHALRAIEALL